MLLAKGMPNVNLRAIYFIFIVLFALAALNNLGLFREREHDVLPIKSAVSLGEGLSPEEQYFARLSREFKLTNETEWLAWRIQHSKNAAGWSAVNRVRQKFGSHDAKVVLTEQPNPLDLRVAHRMDLPVLGDLTWKAYNGSNLVFGITTTYAKIMESEGALLRSWTRWLTNGYKKSNGASLILMLDQADDDEVEEIEEILRVQGVDAQVSATEEPVSVTTRYHELARVLKSFSAVLSSSGGSIKRWFALVEDDIFFPNIEYLQDRLASYNADEELYIGLPSEQDDWEKMQSNAVTTYGGGAVFLTHSALSTLAKLECFDMPELRDRFHAKRWDVLLKDCFTRNTDLKMHILPSFHNPNNSAANLEVDAYETGIRPLVLHRVSERHGMDVNMAHLVTNVCIACFMQRHVFHDNWMLITGVSISQHIDELKFIRDDKEPTRSPMPRELVIDDEGVDRTELTWTENRRVWRFADSVMSDDGAVWQAYIKKAVGDPGPDSIDSVIILVWENVNN
ncbi:glycosyltransferase family 31 [Trichoderma arundinaceum]|uniref:Glycosyltransferase family 31 n=1 Tax=Trichoderma arundinaceum TaxID=490622 RepID=A0A395NFW0_TRIAR|nr:glycosyltransferase family 31 [Trichoderma arundinaceum]